MQDAAIRGELLAHARELFLRHGFAEVSTRRLAAAAGTTPAMIHYYFGDKLGLYRAMLEEAIQPLLDGLQALRGAAGEEPADVDSIMALYMRMLATNPWLPALIVHEVLDEGGQMRTEFIELFAGRVAPLVIGVLRRERDAGRLRADLDPRLAAVSALSLCVFPFISLPITSRVLGLSIEGRQFDELLDHTLRLFRGGVAARDASP